MLCLITGATGCVGANLVEQVAERGWTPRALRRSSSSLKALEGLTYESAIGDVTDRESLTGAMRGADYVFHVAAAAEYWRIGKELMHAVNVEGTRNVLAAAKAAGVKRVVLTSSVAALGQPPFGHAFNEAMQFNLEPDQFYYGYTKVLAERAAAEAVAAGLEVVIVNPAVIMGPRDVNLIGGSIVTTAAKSGIPFIPRGGVNMIDVADVCQGHIAAAEHGRTGQRYILGGDNLTHREIARDVCAVVGKSPPTLVVGRAALHAAAWSVDRLRSVLGWPKVVNGDQIRYSAETFWFETDKARRELGLRTRPFRETAQRTYDWYAANGYL